jgi:hypothetical protein
MDEGSSSIGSNSPKRNVELSPIRKTKAKKRLPLVDLDKDTDQSPDSLVVKKKKKNLPVSEGNDARTSTEFAFTEMKKYVNGNHTSEICHLIMLFRAYGMACRNLEKELEMYHPVIHKEYSKAKFPSIQYYERFFLMSEKLSDSRQCYLVPCIMDSRLLNYREVWNYCDHANRHFLKVQRLLIHEFANLNLYDKEIMEFMQIFPVADISRVVLLPYTFLLHQVVPTDWNRRNIYD